MRAILACMATTFLYDVLVLVVESVVTMFCLAFGKAKLRSQQLGKLQSLKLLFNEPRFQGSYWFHAVSLGEIKLAETLAAKLKMHDKHCRVIVTTVTQGAYTYAASRNDTFSLVMYYPADLSFIVRRFLRVFQPCVLIIIEGDLWLNQILQTSKRSIPVLVANGRISESTASRYHRLPFLGRQFLSRVNFVFAQTEDFAERFRRAGVLPERVTVSGNMKFGGESIDLSAERRRAMREKWQLSQVGKVITFGSVHPQEMSELSKAIAYLDEATPGIEFVIVPRHPELFSDLQIYESMGLQGSDPSCGEPASPCDGLIPVRFVRQLGVLKELYSISDIGYVGGTFCAVNGHNLIEPALCGIPVLFGPNVREQQVLKEAVIRYGAGHQVQDGVELGRILQRYIEDEQLYARSRENARSMVQSLASMAEKVIHDIMLWSTAPR